MNLARPALAILDLGTYWAQRAADDGLGPHTATQPRRIEDRERQAFPQVIRALSGLKESGAGGARTHDRRIMSPARQQLMSDCLTWADAN